MKVKHCLIGVFFMVLLALTIILSCSAEEYYVKFGENVFSFKVPNTWKRMKGSELVKFRQRVKGSVEGEISYLAVLYKGNKGNYHAVLTATVYQIPPQTTDHLDQMYEEGRKRIQLALEQGNIRNVFSNRKTEINGMSALEKDIETAIGTRLLSYSFYFPDHPEKVIGLDFLCKSEQYSVYQSVFNNIISTLRISFPNEKSE